MADGKNKAWRERLVALVMLAFGNVKDFGRFIETGDVGGPAKQEAPSLTPEVARHMKAIEKAGRFVMPEDVERILSHGPTETPNIKPPHNSTGI